MVRDCQPDDIGMSVSYPLPGTRFFAAVQHELGSKQNWQDSEDLAMLYHGPFTTAFYRWLHRVLHREFRAQRAWDGSCSRALRAPPALRRRARCALAGSVAYCEARAAACSVWSSSAARAPRTRGWSHLVPVEAATD